MSIKMVGCNFLLIWLMIFGKEDSLCNAIIIEKGVDAS